MIWHWCDRYGNPVENDIGFQQDEVGNILQRSGAVKTLACQNCGNEFIVKKNQDEIRQAMDKYTCDECEFDSNVAQQALLHNLKGKKHKINIKEDSRIVGHSNTLTDTASIIFKDKECIILCNKCNDLD